MLPFKLKYPWTRQPPGGWHLPVDGTIVRGDTPDELVQAVRKHFIQNGKAPGNIADDIAMFCHTKWPHLTEPNLDYMENARPSLTRSEVQRRVFDWLFAMALRPCESHPSVEDVNLRTMICEGCKWNKPYRVEDDLYEPIRRKAFLMTRGKLPDKLGWCARWHIDTRLAVQWPESLLGKAEVKEEGCWRNP